MNEWMDHCYHRPRVYLKHVYVNISIIKDAEVSVTALPELLAQTQRLWVAADV